MDPLSGENAAPGDDVVWVAHPDFSLDVSLQARVTFPPIGTKTVDIHASNDPDRKTILNRKMMAGVFLEVESNIGLWVHGSFFRIIPKETPGDDTRAIDQDAITKFWRPVIYTEVA